MCGIVGLSLREPAAWAHDFVAQMSDMLAHRGPDSNGLFACPSQTTYLGFRRLAIRDLDRRADQPMSSSSGRTRIAFNGEIYNNDELASRFCGNRNLRTTGDTEVFLESFESRGETVLSDCNGMFAVAFYHEPTRTLTLARDRMGKKPLYCYEGDGFLAFSSELRAFRRLGLEVDPRQVPYFLHFGYMPSPHTFFKRVSQVCPGESVIVREGRIVARRRFHTPTDLDWGVQDQADPDELDRLLADAVSIRTQSDVPVGVFLSGGVDSSLVAAQIQASRRPGLPTYTVSFEDSRYNEAPFAARVAEHLGLPNTDIRISARQLPNLVDDYLDCYEQPYADTSGFPSMLLCREVKKHVTVALSGDGGDEFFTGYDRYVWYRKALLAQRIPSRLRRILQQWMPALDHRRGVRIQRLLETQDDAALYANLIRVWTAAGTLSDVLADVPDADHVPIQIVRDVFARLRCDSVSKAACFDACYYIPDDLQVKMDRASMRVALEVRCPLLDHRIARLGAQLTQSTKCRNGQKSVLKDQLARHLPRACFERPKRGFGVPMASWLRGPLRERVHEALSQQSFRECGWLNRAYVQAVWDQFQDGRSELATPVWMMFLLSRSIDASTPAMPIHEVWRRSESRRVA